MPDRLLVVRSEAGLGELGFQLADLVFVDSVDKKVKAAAEGGVDVLPKTHARTWSRSAVAWRVSSAYHSVPLWG